MSEQQAALEAIGAELASNEQRLNEEFTAQQREAEREVICRHAPPRADAERTGAPRPGTDRLPERTCHACARKCEAAQTACRDARSMQHDAAATSAAPKPKPKARGSPRNSCNFADPCRPSKNELATAPRRNGRHERAAWPRRKRLPARLKKNARNSNAANQRFCSKKLPSAMKQQRWRSRAKNCRSSSKVLRGEKLRLEVRQTRTRAGMGRGAHARHADGRSSAHGAGKRCRKFANSAATRKSNARGTIPTASTCAKPA